MPLFTENCENFLHTKAQNSIQKLKAQEEQPILLRSKTIGYFYQK
jgi:hypothetical protein